MKLYVRFVVGFYPYTTTQIIVFVALLEKFTTLASKYDGYLKHKFETLGSKIIEEIQYYPPILPKAIINYQKGLGP